MFCRDKHMFVFVATKMILGAVRSMIHDFHGLIITQTFRRALTASVDKSLPFSGVTSSGGVWRKVPESDAPGVGCGLSRLCLRRLVSEFLSFNFPSAPRSHPRRKWTDNVECPQTPSHDQCTYATYNKLSKHGA